MDLIVQELLQEDRPPYPAPKGYIWEKSPDEYDGEIVWEGGWNLTESMPLKYTPSMPLKPKVEVKIVVVEKTCSYPGTCKWNCPNQHMEDHYCYEVHGGYDIYEKKLIKEQREIISRNLNHHVCKHNTHRVCSKSLCCDFFWHEGECEFVSADGECGIAVRYGDQ